MRHDSDTSPIRLLPVLALILMILGYTSPWLSTTGTSLSTNAYDLAEWGSLHPTVRATSQILLPALLLRIPLPLIGVLGLVTSRRHLLTWLIAFGVWLALIPPVAFFRGEFTDANYLQQFVLWFTYTCISALLLLAPNLYHTWLGIGLCIGGLMCGAIGAYWTLNLMARYQIAVQPGWGVWLWVVACIIYVAIMTLARGQQR